MEEERIATVTRRPVRLSSDMDSWSSRKNYKKPLLRPFRIHLLSHHQLTHPSTSTLTQNNFSFPSNPPSNQHAFHHPDPPDLDPGPEQLLRCHVNGNREIPGSGQPMTSIFSCLQHPAQEGPLSPLPSNPQSNAPSLGPSPPGRSSELRQDPSAS